MPHLTSDISHRTHLTSDHHILHLTSHYPAVCPPPPTTISHHHISKHIFHITQPQSTSRHFPHPPLPHHTHIQHHISHHTIIYITLHHHILIKRHTTTLDITQPIASFSTSDITHATLFFTLKFHATTFHNTYATFHTIPYITSHVLAFQSCSTSHHSTSRCLKLQHSISHHILHTHDTTVHITP